MAACVCEVVDGNESRTSDLSVPDTLKQLYEKRLKELDQCRDSPDSEQLKIELLTFWVNDLEEQNALLVQTVQEMCNQIQLIQEKACACCECSKAKDAADKEEIEQLLTRIGNLKCDIANLLKLICRAREKGTWSIDNMTFYEVNPEEILQCVPHTDKTPPIVPILPGPVIPHPPRAPRKEELEKKNALIEKLQAEIVCLKSACNDNRDCEIAKLKQCLQQKDCQIRALVKRIQELREDMKNKSCAVTQLLSRRTADACCMTEDSVCSFESSSSDSKCYGATDSDCLREMTSHQEGQCELQTCLAKQLEEAEIFLEKAMRDKERLTDEVAVLYKQLCAQKVKIMNLTKCLSESEQTSRDMQSALNVEVSNKHNIIIMLRQNNFVLQDSCRRMELQNHCKDDMIRDLRKELKQARKKICMFEQELTRNELRQSRSNGPSWYGKRYRALPCPAWYPDEN